MKIFLIGFMGSGKTTIGKLLAIKLSYRFIDLDEDIEAFSNLPINEIFSNRGEEGFRKLEQEQLQKYFLTSNIVVATGGGTACSFDNLKNMNDFGNTIYLKCSIDNLYQRLILEKENRPLIKNKNSEELRIFIKSKLQEREIFYNQANKIIDTENFTTKQIVEIIYNNYAT